MINLDELIQSIPKGLNQLEVARYLYIELGRYFTYDQKIIWANTKEERRAIAEKKIDEIENGEAVCKVIARTYVKALTMAGINASLVVTPESPHIPYDIGHEETKIEINGKAAIVDLTNDLATIKVGFKTYSFSIPELEEVRSKAIEFGNISEIEEINDIEDKRLREIDDKIGYTQNRKVFR